MLPLVDPTWAVVAMLLAFTVGLIGGVRLTSGFYMGNRMNNRY